MKRLLLNTTATLLVLAITSVASVHAHAESADTATAATSDDPVETITVKGLRKTKVPTTGALGARSALDTPFGISVIDSDAMLDRQLNSLGQVFADDPSVNGAGNTYTFHSNHLNVRGLQLDESNGFKINGLPIYSFSVELPLEDFQQVELLKGATGFMYGFGSPGGIVNYVTKKPGNDPVASFDFGYHGGSLLTAHADVGGRAGANDVFGYRINATTESGDAYNGASVHRNALVGSFDARLTPDLLWTADLIYQERDTSGQVQGFGTAFYTGSEILPTVDGARELPASNGTFFNTKFALATTGLQWRISPNWKAKFDISASDRLARFAADWFYPVDSSGETIDYLNASRSENKVNLFQGLVEGDVTTGVLKHHLVIGASYQKQENYSNANQVWGYLGTLNLYEDTRLTYDNSNTYAPYHSADYIQKAVFASDSIDLTSKLQLLAGLRYTDYEQTSFNTSGVETSTYTKSPITPTIALLYKPVPDATVYVSYVEALEQGSVVGSTYANADEILNPLRSKQYEAGVKYKSARWGGNAALFRVERGAEYANADNYYVQNGEVRYQGVEVNGYVSLTDNLKLSGGVTALDTSYRKGDASIEGNRAEGAPRNQAVANFDYKVSAVPGLSLNLGARANGNEAIDAANTLFLPGYTLYNAGAKYTTEVSGRPVTFRVQIENLADKQYWYYVQSGYFYTGAPRTVSANIQFGF
ncbi:MAG: TonB-dependent siderophore receptor [Asticcacaulis sp.]|uniref:TonB-dependent siderophore receptor n=1 Tax=Asticcacaulis sp. TaxID=1872648 RepID=UPI0039E2ADBA